MLSALISGSSRAIAPGFLSPLPQVLRFAWLLTLHPTAAGRTYAAYGAFIFSRLCVALGGRWHQTYCMGCGRVSGGYRGDGHHYVCAATGLGMAAVGTSGFEGLAGSNSLTFNSVQKSSTRIKKIESEEKVND